MHTIDTANLLCAELKTIGDAKERVSRDNKRFKQEAKRLEATNDKLIDSNSALAAQLQEAGRAVDLKDQLGPMFQAQTQALDSRLDKVRPLVGFNPRLD